MFALFVQLKGVQCLEILNHKQSSRFIKFQYMSALSTRQILNEVIEFCFDIFLRFIRMNVCALMLFAVC